MTDEERNMRVPHVCTLGCQIFPMDHLPETVKSYLWTTDGHNIWNTEGERKATVPNDPRFARALCHLLNGCSTAKLRMSDEEMDMRGVAQNGSTERQ